MHYKGRYGESLVNFFKYCHQFGLHFLYCYQVDDYNSSSHSLITLDRTWDTKFFPDCNFAWYPSVMDMKT